MTTILRDILVIRFECFFIKELVLKGCFLGLIAITVVIHRYMVCRSIIGVAFGIDISGKTY